MNKLDQLKRKSKLSQRLMSTNGKTDLPPYAPVFIFGEVYCNSCKAKYTVAQGDVVICRSGQELLRKAEDSHSQIIKQRGILCSKSALLISYDNAFISTHYLLDAADESVS